MAEPTYMIDELFCPHCKHINELTFAEVLDKDEIACRNCGTMIDISDEKLQARWRQDAKDIKKIELE